MSYILISRLDDLILYDEHMASGDSSIDFFNTEAEVTTAMVLKQQRRDNLHKLEFNDYEFSILRGERATPEEVKRIEDAYYARLRELGE